jgi:hypothetical protein
MSAAKRIIIVGGGIAGLAAARAAVLRGRELKRDVKVTLLERSPRLGGVLVTERVDGFLLDAGADSWVVAKPQATALARALGLGGSLLGTRLENRRYYVGWGERLHLVPEGLVLGVPTRIGPLLTTRLFTWRGKARMAMEPFVAPRRFEGDDDESIADFATRRLGREAAERLVAPLLGGISAGDASDISVRAAFPQLVAMEREHGSLVRGMRFDPCVRFYGDGLSRLQEKRRPSPARRSRLRRTALARPSDPGVHLGVEQMGPPSAGGVRAPASLFWGPIERGGSCGRRCSSCDARTSRARDAHEPRGRAALVTRISLPQSERSDARGSSRDVARPSRADE